MFQWGIIVPKQNLTYIIYLRHYVIRMNDVKELLLSKSAFP